MDRVFRFDESGVALGFDVLEDLLPSQFFGPFDFEGDDDRISVPGFFGFGPNRPGIVVLYLFASQDRRRGDMAKPNFKEIRSSVMVPTVEREV